MIWGLYTWRAIQCRWNLKKMKILKLIISKESKLITFAAKSIVFVDICSWLTVPIQITILFSNRIFKWTAICLAVAPIWTINNWFFNWWVTSNLACTWEISWDKLKSSRANYEKSKISCELECLHFLKSEMILWWSTYRAVARSENPGRHVILGGDNVPPLVEIGLTDLTSLRQACAWSLCHSDPGPSSVNFTWSLHVGTNQKNS